MNNNDLKCGSIIVTPPIQLNVKDGKYIIQVNSNDINCKDILSSMSISGNGITPEKLEILKKFVEEVYKIGWSEASSFIMNKSTKFKIPVENDVWIPVKHEE
jgi:hypothetical protein